MASTSKKRKTEDADEKKQKKAFTLNVGGERYITSIQTLEKSPTLKDICNGGTAEQTRDDEGNIFIDRDGKLFKFVMRYLRLGKIILPAGFAGTDALIEEASYYKLEELKTNLQKHKKKLTTIFWVKVVNEHENDNTPQKLQTKEAAKLEKIYILCLLGTFLSLNFFQTANPRECIEIKKIGSVQRNRLGDYRYEPYENRLLSYTFFTEFAYKFFEAVQKEGFEKTGSQNGFTTYGFRHSDVAI